MKMKKVFVLLIVVASYGVVITGCSDSTLETSKQDSHSNQDVLETECAFIDVNRMFVSLAGDYYADGKAYEADLSRDVRKPYLLCDERSFILKDGKFEQFCVPHGENCWYYAGSYDVSDDGQLILNYQRYYDIYPWEKLEVLRFDINDNMTAEYDGATDTFTCEYNSELTHVERAWCDKFFDANIHQYTLGLGGLFGGSEKSPYIDAPYFLIGHPKSQEYKPCSVIDPKIPVYVKEDYLVAEQTGYSFTGDISSREFTLEYDVTSISKPNRQSVISFQKDNTWVRTVGGESICSGAWELYDDNLLIIYPPNGEQYIEKMLCMLYLDFEEEEVYVPAYFRCDEVISIRNKMDYEKADPVLSEDSEEGDIF